MKIANFGRTQRLSSLALSVSLVAFSAPAFADSSNNKKEASSSEATKKVDNSEANKRYQGVEDSTADQQSNKEVDVEIIRKIRQAIVEDKTLSTYAHNIKILSENGQVVLKGPVRSSEEKISIEKMATQIAGQGKVKNELEIAAH